MTTFKVHLKGEDTLSQLTVEELQECLGFTYLEELSFESAELEEKIRKGCQTQKIARLIPEQEIERGERWGACRKLPKVSIRFVSELVGYGLFAEEHIPAGTFIGEYTGTIRTAGEGSYIFGYGLYNLKERYILDGSSGNFTRFINHSNRPNLLVHDAFYNGFHRTLFEAAFPIMEGEQLLINYGPRYWEGHTPPESLRP